MPAQIIATEAMIEKPGEAKHTEADGDATTSPRMQRMLRFTRARQARRGQAREDRIGNAATEPNDAKDAPVEAVKLAEAKSTETKPTEANGVATTELKDAEDAPVGAAQPRDESSTVKYSTLSDDKPTVDDTSEQGAMPAQIIATGPTIEKPGEAKPTETKPTEADGVATTELNGCRGCSGRGGPARATKARRQSTRP